MTDILQGDCVEVMAAMPEASVDAVVTDSPYELGFMGRKWDASGVSYQVETWAACLRVLKPGGHLLAFGGSRTYHRMACAVEDAGFEIRDQIMWLYGSGFPKSLDVGKAMDKAAGIERKRMGAYAYPDGKPRHWEGHTTKRSGIYSDIKTDDASNDRSITAPATDLARRWHGWGTALKPAHEPIVVARKPLIGTVAANVEKHGTGAINVDGCRIATDGARPSGSGNPCRNGNADIMCRALGKPDRNTTPPSGRWPANVILDEEAGAMLDGQSGERRSSGLYDPGGTGERTGGVVTDFGGRDRPATMFSDTGGASRFFYCPKASRKERGESNRHPTVKPVALMRYLVRLVTPPGGIVLDPFLGSGTTALACIEEGFDCIGIEREEEYVEIAKARVKHWQEKPAQLRLGDGEEYIADSGR